MFRWRLLIAALLFGLLMPGCQSVGNQRAKAQAHAIIAQCQPPSPAASRADVLRACAQLAKARLPYKFGGESLAERGMDCSGTVHYILRQVGYLRPPRVSAHQYLWCREQGSLRSWPSDGLPRGIAPGDLIFWENTYSTGRRYPRNVSHVMFYMGRDGAGRYWQFGGRGSRQRGRNGAGIDFHRFRPTGTPSGRGKIIGWAPIPGIR